MLTMTESGRISHSYTPPNGGKVEVTFYGPMILESLEWLRVLSELKLEWYNRERIACAGTPESMASGAGLGRNSGTGDSAPAGNLKR